MKKMRRNKLLAVVLVVFLAGLVPGTSWAATIYVDVNFPNPTGFEDGSQQFPFPRIQLGINAALGGDVVQVAAGLYNESIRMKDGVSVFGAGAGLSIIDGGGRSDSVVTFDAVRSNPRFEGFTIRNGKGDRIGMVGFTPINVGGGILILNSGPRIKNVLIENNTIDEGFAYGGGIFIDTAIEVPTITGATIRNNTAKSADAPGEGRGGGIYINSKLSSVLITESIIELNVSDIGGGIFNNSAGNADLTVSRNDISYNEAADGAAIHTRNFTNSSTSIVNNLFVGNGSTAGQKDCNDGNGSSAPGSEELCNDGIDNDCDPATPDIFDADNDGSMCDVDCNDSDATIFPAMFEHCGDMIDNDCDGAIDFSNPDNIVLVEFGSAMTYLANASDPGLAQTWVATAFDDSAWVLGTYGVGYEDEPPGAESLIPTIVTSGASSVYTRTVFDITDTIAVNALFLAGDVDDGYAAWLNGVEVFRSSEMPAMGDFDWNTLATAGESSNGLMPDYGTLVDISMAGLPALVNGTNVLAVGVWNDVNTSPDLVLVPRLSMSLGPDDADCLCADTDGDFYSCSDCDDAVAATNPGTVEVCNDGIDNDCNVATTDIFDRDGDTFNCLIDCDDDTAAINPSATEVPCDGIDNDCNVGTPDIVDNDIDFVDCRFDCNDNAASIFPGQTEFCFDGVDNNCDGFIDGQDLECSCANPIDADSDGYRCTDCNDGNAAINPGAVEICNDGIDNDCNDATLDIFDGDQDGDNCDTDCQDFDATVHAAAIEICNDTIDNDCDTLTDLADPDCAGGDGDMDGYDSSVDCNDGDAAVNPGAAEICNDGIDNDCNVATVDLSDADGDGFDCVTDCNDNDPAIFPNAPEDCADLVDNDCDGFIDAVNPDLVLVQFGSVMKYLANETDPGIGISFSNVVFNDATWNSGIYGVGYQFGIGIGVQDLAVTTVPVGTASVYTRANFEIPATSAVNGVFVGADYDDGYVMWINGTEVHRSPEMPVGVPTWDANPVLHESSNGMVPDYGTLLDITTVAQPLLTNGTNLFVVAVYNDIPAGGGNSSDLIIVPRLSLNFGDNDPDCLCPDLDGDGYSCTDCNDLDALRSPGLPEIGCDMIDNDCDSGTTDIFDGDGDGFDCTLDCNDNDGLIFPGGVEIPCDNANNDCDAFTPDVFDLDLDTYDCLVDCDETSAAINPGATEIGCDGIDNDCNTLTADVDDADFDTYRCDQDCDDTNPAVNPGAFEKCNDGIDNDCDTFIDGPADIDCTCTDVDIDGYQCQDCNDGDATIHPAMPEICNDTIDNDCDPATPDVGDVDGDGFDCLADCDDTDPFIRPNAAELCNDGIDNDCNAATLDIIDADADTFMCDVDCDDNDSAINPGITEQCNDTIDNDCNPSTVDIGDLDFDGVICIFDCDDGDNTISPNVAEVCNDGIDNDCNPATPDVFDGDGDGTTCDIDCDDMDAARGQTVAEHCTDGIDNDCDGNTDGADTDCGCGDGDSDGYSCSDCDDVVPTTNPGAMEVCNDGIDNDCNPATLDIDDLDNDGFLCSEECDDNDPLAFPSGQEICNDGIDNDCNPATLDLFDGDSDTYMCDVDCDDVDPLINPGQVEIGCDELDNDCDPLTSDLADADMDGFTCVDATVRGGAVTALAPSASSSVTIINNTFYDNGMPSGIGGALYVDDMAAPNTGVVANNIFVNNVAELGGAMVQTAFFGDLSNNDFFTNTPSDLYDAGGSGANATANMFIDPQFANVAALNYRLAGGSPLIDAADPTVAPTNDFDRVERPYDGDGDLTALPDIGAFEWPSDEVFGLVFVAPDSVSWQVADPGDIYNLYRGGLAILKNTGNYTQPLVQPVSEQFCEVAAASLPLVDTFDPPVGGAVAYYLVTRRGFAVEGSLGNDWTGALRLNAVPCP